MKKLFKTKNIHLKEKMAKVNNHNDKAIEEFHNSHSFQKPVSAHSRTLVFSLVISIIFGFLAGVLCLLLFLSGAFSHSPIFSWLNIDSLLPTTQIVVEKHERVNVSEDERISKIINEASPSVVGIFNYKKPVTDIQRDSYLQKDFLGNGLILTSDGWIVTTSDVVKNIKDKYAVIIQSGEILPVETIKQDPEIKLIFLKVKANNLSAASLAWRQDISSGEKVVLLGGLDYFNKNLLVSRIADCDFQVDQKLVRNTENYYLFISLTDNKLGRSFLSAPAFNFNKQSIGLLTGSGGNNYIIPVDYLKRSFDQLLKGSLKKAYLGIEYINLASTLNPDFNEDGALIIKIKKDSPLFNLIGSKVNLGDIILKVGDENLNGEKNLTNLIQEYKTGDKISLTILDKNNMKEKKIEVVLK